MNRFLDGVVGGWTVSTIVTFQTGTPISIGMASARLADGTQRPNVICPSVASGFSYHQAAANGQNIALGADIDPNSASVFNASCFADPEIRLPATLRAISRCFVATEYTTLTCRSASNSRFAKI